MENLTTSKRILIIESQMSGQELFDIRLRAYGYNVKREFDGPSGLGMANVFLPHAVILNLGRDTMDNYEIAVRLRANECLHDTYLISLSDGGIQTSNLFKEARFDVVLTNLTGHRLLIDTLNKHFFLRP